MCRSATEHADTFPYRDRLKIRSFRLRFLLSSAAKLPEALTLIYPGRTGVPEFVVLNRDRSEEGAVYASSDRVSAAPGFRFEAYVGAEAVIRGAFRRIGGGSGWGMECRCIGGGISGVAAADISVAAEGGVVFKERVEFKRRGRGRGRGKGFCLKLEEIPEDMEGEERECCCCSGDDGEDEGEWEMVGRIEEEMEGVKWAVDMGIWAVCLGVGLLVSKASYKGFKMKF